jgi:hypothetical protein
VIEFPKKGIFEEKKGGKRAMGYFLTGLICLVVGGLVGASLVWWFGVHKKKIPDVTKP